MATLTPQSAQLILGLPGIVPVAATESLVNTRLDIPRAAAIKKGNSIRTPRGTFHHKHLLVDRRRLRNGYTSRTHVLFHPALPTARFNKAFWMALTKRLDKLPAIAGLAKLATGGQSDQYLAGLRRHQLFRDMVWAIEWCDLCSLELLFRSIDRPDSYLAPS
ncbi:hypothetical protein PG994_008559 [Apiospora phragmitis]|uniref:Uncharacterized protein n=1 Tax=Apiospora phragmitis TaxID=2905665 RepID=A0ABR1UGU0_9PEZI